MEKDRNEIPEISSDENESGEASSVVLNAKGGIEDGDARDKVFESLKNAMCTEEAEEESISEKEEEFLLTFGFETFQEAMRDYKAFNGFICMLADPEFLESISKERLYEMILDAASTPDQDLADTFLSNLDDIATVIDNSELLKKAREIAEKTVGDKTL